MASIRIHAGDFKEGKVSANISQFCLILTYPVDHSAPGFFGESKSEMLDWKEIEELTEASEENVKRLGGTIGWGAVGGVLLGPVGLLAGLLAGGRGKDINFVLKMKDGRKMLATTDSKTFTKLHAATF